MFGAGFGAMGHGMMMQEKKEIEEQKEKERKEKGKGTAVEEEVEQQQQEEEEKPTDDSPTKRRHGLRGLSASKLLTKLHVGKQRREKSISKEDISSPILDQHYLPSFHAALIPLGEISQSPPSPKPFSSPYLASPIGSRPAPAAPSPPILPDALPERRTDTSLTPPPSEVQQPSNLQRKPAVRKRAGTQHSSRARPKTPPPTPNTAQLIASDSGWNTTWEPISTRGTAGHSVQESLDVAAKKLSWISESQEPEYHGAQEATRNLVAAMDRASLQPPPNAGTKLRAIQQAKETEQLVAERAKRSDDEPPPYEFLELIGKGAYGRVFKGRSRDTGGLVAIKIIDTDKTDYEEMTTKNLQETLREINILQQLKDSRARPYVNIIEEARTVHNELWIVSEYASGGSVNTLMKPRMNLPNKGLEEKYIVPIARELALGLKFIHEAGVIHRDLKSNNILILEDGRVQLCDFGVSGAMEPEIAKRSTIVGTPNWMAPELKREWVKDLNQNSSVRPNEILYGSEVDIWAYGCTIYEMATGLPPFHTTKPFLLPDAGPLQLEGDQYSDELKSLVSSVMQPDPRQRPTADTILEHPFLFDSTKMFPTVTLVALVEQYYRWEQQGGSRISLFNPYGAQAPDPLALEPEDEDEDWTFSTSDEFERQHADEFDPFMGPTAAQDFAGMNAPPQDEDRFAKLQASIRAEQADRGKKRLDRLFDTSSTPYRLSAMDPDTQRLSSSSDLALRDFNPGAPRESVIDLDFAAPTAEDIPSIDLGEVPTVKANRLHRMMRDMELEEEEPEAFDMDQTARRATREWKFPMMAEDPGPMPEQSNRRTQDWTFPQMQEEPMQEEPKPEKKRSNRATMEWTFDMSMAESNVEPVPSISTSRMSRLRDTQDPFSMNAVPSERNRRTGDFKFPPDPEEGMSGQGDGFSSSPPRRPSLRYATTEPLGSFSDFANLDSAPQSPVQSSMIDLDMAYVDDFRPSTAGSGSTSTYTAGLEQSGGNPFDLEDQVHLSQTNNRLSYHMKSQSEPNHAIPGLLTPQAYDEQGYPVNQDPPMHARGVSSASQMQAKPPPRDIGYRQRIQQQGPWDGWSHQDAFGKTDDSSPISVSPATDTEDEPTIEDRWNKLEKQNTYQRRQQSGFRSRRTASTDNEDPRSDADDHYASMSDSQSYDDFTTARQSRVSVGPNGRPLVDFPIPKGPDAEAIAGPDTDSAALAEALWKGAVEMKNGLGASRDLLRNMRLASVEEDKDE